MEHLNLHEILTSQDPDPEYLVQDLLYKGQMLMVAGEPGAGKSFLQYHVALCLAAGLPVLGRVAEKVKVLYFDEENSRPDLQQYLRWIWRGLGCPPLDSFQDNLFVEHFSLSRHAARRFTYMAECARAVSPGLIIIDTVTPCCAIKDENDNGEASTAMRGLRVVKEAAGKQCTMILLKHSKFSHDPLEKQTIRGAKTWLGEVDGVIYHKLAQGAPRKDGLRNTRLQPDKVRAFGLRKELIITPDWCGEEGEKGIRLG